MKLRCTPEDFLVTEVTNRSPADGVYGLYRLQKRSIGTLDALQILQRSWNLASRQLSHGGLKDRHAVTTQFITIRNGPSSDFGHDLFDLTYLGRTGRPFEAQDIVGNHFEIVIRSLTADQCCRIRQRTEEISSDGFPNYFDQQRFGSLGESREFIAAYWCRKDYERALWLALAEPNSHDSPNEREQKQILRDFWGRWAECKQRLDRSHRRSIVTYLVDHPDKFRKAFALVNGDLRGLYLSAFQSAVWNRMLACLISHTNSQPSELPATQIGDTTVPIGGRGQDVPTEFEQLPLPSVRCKNLTPGTKKICDAALQFYNMTLKEMKVHFPRDRWFSRALRQAFVTPGKMSTAVGEDRLQAGAHALTLNFELPRGSYATMLIKTVTTEADKAESTAEHREPYSDRLVP